MTSTIAVPVGSLCERPSKRKLAQALAGLAQSRLSFHHVQIGDLPHHDDGLWQDAKGQSLSNG